MSIEIKNLSYLEVVSEDQKVKGGFWHKYFTKGGDGEDRESSNEAHVYGNATALGKKTKSYAYGNADVIEGHLSTSTVEGYASSHS